MSSSMSNSMKGSVMLKCGTIHEINSQVVHPFTKLDTESGRMIGERVFEHYSGSPYAGSLNADQVRRLLEDVNRLTRRKEPVTDEDIRDFLEYHDKDNDKSISRNDILSLSEQYLCGPGGSGLSLTSKHTAREDLIEFFIQDEDPNVKMPNMTHVSKLFESYDTDGNGSLDRSEIRRLLTDTYKLLKREPPTDEEIDSYMGGKNRITKEEYIAAITNSLAKRHLVKTVDN